MIPPVEQPVLLSLDGRSTELSFTWTRIDRFGVTALAHWMKIAEAGGEDAVWAVAQLVEIASGGEIDWSEAVTADAGGANMLPQLQEAWARVSRGPPDRRRWWRRLLKPQPETLEALRFRIAVGIEQQEREMAAAVESILVRAAESEARA
jgi:hypothetical protein